MVTTATSSRYGTIRKVRLSGMEMGGSAVSHRRIKPD